MVSRKKIATTAAASFGVAMASMYIVPEMNADVEDLTYNGGAASADNPFFNGSGTPYPVFIDQVDSVGAAWLQWNDTFGGTGRTQPFYTSAGPGPMSVDVVMSGDVIDPATFVGRMTTTTLGAMVPDNLGGGTEFDGTGSAFVAVRPRTAPTNLFWFRMDYTQGGSIIYSGGQYGSMGEALTVGGGKKKCVVGDLNGDGLVTLLDVDPFVDAINSGTFSCEADANLDGVVTLLDVDPFVAILQGG